MLTIGVVADTHVPDRISAVPAGAFEIFRQQKVAAILHAGDLSDPRILDDFAAIAPVFAVQGNRDIWRRAGRELPLKRVLEFEGVKIGMTHGHGGLGGYLWEKVLYYTVGFSTERVLRNLAKRFPADTDIIVFGHTHRPVIRRRNGKLFFNPGSLGPLYNFARGPVVGLLRIEAGNARAEHLRVNL